MSGITPCHGEIVLSIADAYPLVKVRPARGRVSPARGPVPSVALVGGLRGAHGSDGDGDPWGPLPLSRRGADAGSAAMEPLLPGRRLVETRRLELLTLSLQRRCSSS